MAVRGGGGAGRLVVVDPAQVAIDAHAFEKSVGHDDLAGPRRVHAVLAGNLEILALRELGLPVGEQHRPIDVREGDVLRLGDLHVDVAEPGKREIQVLLRA